MKNLIESILGYGALILTIDFMMLIAFDAVCKTDLSKAVIVLPLLI